MSRRTSFIWWFWNGQRPNLIEWPSVVGDDIAFVWNTFSPKFEAYHIHAFGLVLPVFGLFEPLSHFAVEQYFDTFFCYYQNEWVSDETGRNDQTMPYGIYLFLSQMLKKKKNFYFVFCIVCIEANLLHVFWNLYSRKCFIVCCRHKFWSIFFSFTCFWSNLLDHSERLPSYFKSPCSVDIIFHMKGYYQYKRYHFPLEWFVFS